METSSRPLPNAIEAERALLCAAMMNRDVLVDSPLPDGAFYEYRHAKLWTAMHALADRGAIIDPVTIGGEIQADPEHDQIQLALTEIIASQGGLPAAAPEYRQTILEAWQRRQLIEAAQRLTDAAYDRENDIVEAGASVMRQLSEIGGHRSTTAPLKEFLATAIAQMEAEIHDQKSLSGFDTGFAAINRITHGLHAPDVVILAARPSAGKTSLAVNIARNIAKAGVPVAFFSLEQSGAALARRMIAAEASVNQRKLRNLPDDAQRDIGEASVTLAKLPFYLDQHGGHTAASLRSEARRLVAKHGVRVVFIDYLQIIRQADRRQSRYEHLTEVSGDIKRMAKELDIVVVALSQLSRNSAHESRRPGLHDLRETGALEQDADVAILLSNEPADDELPPSLLGKITDEDRRDIIIADIAKNREGAIGLAFLRFNREHTRFGDIAP